MQVEQDSASGGVKVFLSMLLDLAKIVFLIEINFRLSYWTVGWLIAIPWYILGDSRRTC